MQFRRFVDCGILRDFTCGVEAMDNFIHERLQYSIDANFCVPYIVTEGNNIIAFFALSYDSLALPSDYLEDFIDGYSSSGKPSLADCYLDTFKNKEHYPAMDIAYFAVSEEWQCQGIGTLLIEDIIAYVKSQTSAGCQFIVVDALVTNDYSAVSFYARNGFTVCEDKKPYKDCVRMYRVLYPQTEDHS